MNNKSLWLTNLGKEKWSSRHPDHALKTSYSLVCSHSLHNYKVVNFKHRRKNPEFSSRSSKSSSSVIRPWLWLKVISLASFSEDVNTGRSPCLKNVDCLTFLFRAKNDGLDPVLHGFSAVRVVKNVWCLSSLIAAGCRRQPALWSHRCRRFFTEAIEYYIYWSAKSTSLEHIIGNVSHPRK